ncbi:MAG: C_GCAxxG_C_C family protein [Deltaproteobacteria bacterium]|nr:C_GCAxxG_C_C family protein [Candidatus Anaeroferrophillus wilburensis]MBN2889811.1 C_GCAxxG_C_C family protein [Deltaproteobacteria bacterium]
MNLAYKSEKDLLDSVEASAANFEKKYHGCAQCVLGALMEAFPDLRSLDVFKAATGLGGGVGLSVAGSCGGLTGGVMLLSYLYGRDLDNIDDPEGIRFIGYRLANALHECFVEEYGTSTCGEIHKQVMGRTYQLNDPADWDAFIQAGGHEDKCPAVVGKAARWAAEIIVAEETAQGRKPHFLDEEA